MLETVSSGPVECPTLREVLNENAWWCLGEWRGHPLLENCGDCRFTGLRSKDFSLYDIGLALRAGFEVFLQAGMLRYQNGVCTLNQTAAVDRFGSSIAQDFGWKAQEKKTEDLMPLLREILPQLRSDTGYIVAAQLRQALSDRNVATPDRRIAELEQQGKIAVYAEDYGQSRHGEGLYNDPRKQLIKIRLLCKGDSE